MKTKNNVQKTILRSVAVFVSFVLISFTVSAQGFWKKLLTNSSFNEIAIAMIQTSNETEIPSTEKTTQQSTYFATEQLCDPALELENWMTNDYYFINFYFQTEQENMLQLEDWMTNETLFNLQNNEEHLVLEDWMTNDLNWKI